jgi:hypothetical protein
MKRWRARGAEGGERDAALTGASAGGFEGCDEHGNPIGQRYFVGIIDILMLYTRRKKLERFWKSTTEGTSGGGCSSQVCMCVRARRLCGVLEGV